MIAIYSIDEHPSTWDSNASLILQEVDAENNIYQLRKVDMSVFGNILLNGQQFAMDKLGAVINLMMKEREEIKREENKDIAADEITMYVGRPDSGDYTYIIETAEHCYKISKITKWPNVIVFGCMNELNEAVVKSLRSNLNFVESKTPFYYTFDTPQFSDILLSEDSIEFLDRRVR